MTKILHDEKKGSKECSSRITEMEPTICVIGTVESHQVCIHNIFFSQSKVKLKLGLSKKGFSIRLPQVPRKRADSFSSEDGYGLE